MYKHYESSEDVFVDREDHIEWMNEALKRCKSESVVLHLKGIGGIGKSSLLNHWINTHEKTIILDCEQYSEFYQRLNMLAKGAVLHGIKLQRFDILWQIRQRFVEGVEPVREEGRQWAKEVVMAIPFIGSLASIGSAISAVGSEVTPRLKGKYSTIGKWLQETLGKNHIEQLLQILWKEPRRAEFLYLEALLEDINTRKGSDTPLVLLLDHFENVDDKKDQWMYQRTKINETQLWTIFLCNLANCVGVLASRRSASDSKLINVEESELLELDKDSCFEMLELQGVGDRRLQERIVSVSGGNPFVIDAICDMINTSDVTISDIEGLRADTLVEVRMKVWRRLFKHAEGLQNLINRAGILPYFDERIMRIIAPEMTLDGWDRLRSLSFTKLRSDGSFVLHDLAEDLVRAELGDNLGNLAGEVSDLLEKKYNEEGDFRLLGLSISVQGLHTPESALERVVAIANNLSWRGQFRSAVELLDSVSFKNLREQTIVSWIKAHHLTGLDRVAEAEHLLKEAIEVLEDLVGADLKRNIFYLGQCLNTYGLLLHRLRRPIEAEAMFERAMRITREIEKDPAEWDKNLWFFGVYWWYSLFLMDMHRLNEAADLLRRALDLEEHGINLGVISRERAFTLGFLGYVLLLAGKIIEAEEVCKEILDAETEDINKLNSLQHLGHIYRLTSRFQEAKDVYRKSFDLVRRIAFQRRFTPTHYSRQYALAMKFEGNYIEAETYYKEALERAREAVQSTPEMHLHELSQVLNDFAILYYEMSQYSKAREYYEEAIRNFERLSQDSPELHKKYMAWTLNNYSILLHETGVMVKAQKSYQEALEISRELVQKYPENIFHSHLLGQVLNNLGVLLRNMNKQDEAEEVLREALEVRQELDERTPEVFLGSIATTLNNLGVVLSITNRLQEARDVSLRGLQIRRELVERSPEMHSGRLGFILNNLGNIYKLSDENSKAEKCYQEAFVILEDLAGNAPSVYQRYAIMILSNLLLYHNQQAELQKAESIKRRLEKLEFSEINKQEIWIEEKDTEAGAFYDTTIS
ncbi:MAG: tetratricopeptide repeat protein [Candidatus Thorarchaeota archaeon]